jgi:hypothetical protein
MRHYKHGRKSCLYSTRAPPNTFLGSVGNAKSRIHHRLIFLRCLRKILTGILAQVPGIHLSRVIRCWLSPNEKMMRESDVRGCAGAL